MTVLAVDLDLLLCMKLISFRTSSIAQDLDVIINILTRLREVTLPLFAIDKIRDIVARG